MFGMIYFNDVKQGGSRCGKCVRVSYINTENDLRTKQRLPANLWGMKPTECKNLNTE